MTSLSMSYGSSTVDDPTANNNKKIDEDEDDGDDDDEGKQTTDYYLLNVARDLLNVCMTRNATPVGNLYTGGLGPWVYLPMKLSEHLHNHSIIMDHNDSDQSPSQNNTTPTWYLCLARDAAYEALQYAEWRQRYVARRGNTTTSRNKNNNALLADDDEDDSFSLASIYTSTTTGTTRTTTSTTRTTTASISKMDILTMNSVSIWTNEWIGAKCLLAAILYKLGNNKESWNHAMDVIQRLEKDCCTSSSSSSSSSSSTPYECNVLYGRAGALQAIWFLRQELHTPDLGQEFVVDTARAILVQGLTCAAQQQQQQQQQHAGTTATTDPQKRQLMLLWTTTTTTTTTTHTICFNAIKGIVGIVQSLLGGMTEKEWELLELKLPRAKDVLRHTIDTLEYYYYNNNNGNDAAAAAAAATHQRRSSPSKRHRHHHHHHQQRKQQQELLGLSCLSRTSDADDENKRNNKNGTRSSNGDWATGYCLLLIKAAEVFQNAEYLVLAKKVASQDIWPHRRRFRQDRSRTSNNKSNKSKQKQNYGGTTGRVFDLCNGLSGDAYVFLALSRADHPSHSEVWTSRARYYARSSITHWKKENTFLMGGGGGGNGSSSSNRDSSRQRLYSLYKGLGGLVSLILDLEHVDTAHYPMYETKTKGIVPAMTTTQPPQKEEVQPPKKEDKSSEQPELALETSLSSIDSEEESLYDAGSQQEPMTTKLVLSPGSSTHSQDYNERHHPTKFLQTHEPQIALLRAASLDLEFHPGLQECTDIMDKSSSSPTTPSTTMQQHINEKNPRVVVKSPVSAANSAQGPYDHHDEVEQQQLQFRDYDDESLYDGDSQQEPVKPLLSPSSSIDSQTHNARLQPTKFMQPQIPQVTLVRATSLDMECHPGLEIEASEASASQIPLDRNDASRTKATQRTEGKRPTTPHRTGRNDASRTQTAKGTEGKHPTTPHRTATTATTTPNRRNVVGASTGNSKSPKTPSSTESNNSPLRRRSGATKYHRLALQLIDQCLENCIPEGNIYTGGLGACVYNRLQLCQNVRSSSSSNKDTETLRLALKAAHAAVATAEGRRGTHHVSFLCGEWIGAKCLLAAVYYKLGDLQEAQQNANDVIAMLSKKCPELPPSECGVMYGRAGALQAIWFLRQELENPLIGKEFALETSRSILLEGIKLAQKDNSPDMLLMWERQGKKLLGPAHGVVGILNALLGHTEQEWEVLGRKLPRVRDVVDRTVDCLEGLCLSSGQLPMVHGGVEEDPNATPGYCFLLMRAAVVFNKARYLDLAKHLAKSVLWPRRGENIGGVGLRGMAGHGYVFLALARADPPNLDMWQSYAQSYAESAFSKLDVLLKMSKRPNSLFDGAGGLATLFLDLTKENGIGYLGGGFREQPTSSLTIRDGSGLLKSSQPVGVRAIDDQGKNQATTSRHTVAHRKPPQETMSTPKKLMALPSYQSKGRQTASDMNRKLPAPSATPKSKARSPAREVVDKKMHGATAAISKAPTPDRAISSVEKTQTPIPSFEQPQTPRAIDMASIEAPSPKKGSQQTNRRLARRLMEQCLENSTSEGGLCLGGIGPCVYLPFHLSSSVQGFVGGAGRASSSNLIKSALDAARKAVKKAESRSGIFQVSFLTGEWIGANCLLAAALYKLGDVESSEQYANQVIEKLKQKLPELPPSECGVMYGRAGALQAIWFLRQALHNPNIGHDLALFTSRLIIREGLKLGQKGSGNNKALLMWEWKGKKFLGAAHGVVGILQSILGHTAEEWDILERDLPRVKDVVRQTIESLSALRHPSGNLYTLVDGDEEDRQMSWSHGSTGYCFLLIRSAEVFNDPLYLDLAKDMAVNLLWKRRTQRIEVGLNGMSGIGYVFLALAQADPGESQIWLSCAEYYASSALENRDDLLALSRRPYSLFGLGGLARLLMDLSSLSPTDFPLYEKTQSSTATMIEKTSDNLPSPPAEVPLSNLAASYGSHDKEKGNEPPPPAALELQDNQRSEVIVLESTQGGEDSPRNEAPRKTAASSQEKHVEQSSRGKRQATVVQSPINKTVSTESNQATERKISDHLSETLQTKHKPSSPNSGQAYLTVSPRALQKLLSVASGESSLPIESEKEVDENETTRPTLLLNPIAGGGQTSLLAQQFINACLKHSTADGNLSMGGIGVCGYLQMRLSQHILRLPGVCRTLAAEPLKLAMDAATEALKHAELLRGSLRVSLLSSEWVGAKCLTAAVLNHLGRVDTARQHALDVISRLQKGCQVLPPSSCDVLNGRAGALLAVWFLRQELGDASLGREFALSTSRSILAEGLQRAHAQKCELPLLWESRGKFFLGAAYGVVGIVQSLLGLTAEEWEMLEGDFPGARDAIRLTIERLENFRHSSGNLRETLNEREEDRLVEWAHGAPGYCLLLIRAAEVFDDPWYLELASDMAESVIWPRRLLRTNIGLSRGMAGHAYVFLALSKADSIDRDKWRKRVEHYAQAIVSNWGDLLPLSSSRPYSLFSGLGGYASLLLDMEHPETSGFPLYETLGVDQAVIAGSRKSRPTTASFQDNVTTTTAPETIGATPRKYSQSMPVSPLTDLHVTPAKDRELL